MPFDVSLEAIEADLAMAERGGQVAVLALARAQIRATLLAPSIPMYRERHLVTEAPPVEPARLRTDPAGAGADIEVGEGLDVVVFTVPKAASWEDRVTAAAMLIGIEEEPLRNLLGAAFGPDGIPIPLEPPAVPDEDELAAPDLETLQRQADFVVAQHVEEGEEPEDIDADFFAEAKKARKKK